MTADPRVRVPVHGKRVNLDVLTEQLGAALCASDTEIVVADPASTVTAQQLQAALDSAQPLPEPVQPLTDDEITRLRALLGP